MKALVIKTDQVVEIVDKKGKYYLDNEANPYKKEELEFFFVENNVMQEENQQQGGLIAFPNFFDFLNGNQQNSERQDYIEHSVFLASTIIQTHPEWSAPDVVNYCNQIMQGIMPKK